jgi:hypothetical protein
MHTFGPLFVRLPTRIYGLTKGEGIDGDRYGGRTGVGFNREIQRVTGEIIIKLLFAPRRFKCRNVKQGKNEKDLRENRRGSREITGLTRCLISRPTVPMNPKRTDVKP